MPSLALFQSHPFSVAWNETVDENVISNDEESMLDRKESDGLDAPKKSSVSFVIRARTGFTYKLLKKAESAPEGRSYAKLYLEGPYGSHHVMHSYGTVMLIAGGIGITHQVPHVRDLVQGYASGTVAIRRLLLVWIVQTPEHLEWIRPWMTQILAMDQRRDVLRVMLFISRPRSTKEIQSPSATVQMFPGRPNLETLVDMEIESQVGAMGVSVCGSGSLSDDVRQVVRQRQARTNIDFHEEAFSW
jgi:NAD(P)H-flavin reductase